MSGRAVFLWVVLPFVALSALALWLTRDTPEHTVAEPPSAPPAPPRAPPAPPPEPARPEPRVATPPPPPPREDEPIPDPPPGTWDKEEVAVAFRAIQPLVRECLQDASVRHPGAQTVKLRFTLEAQGERGRFQGAEVVESTFQDPFVHACLLDALADTQFSAPPGKAPLTLSHPFHFRSGKDGGP
ncbi:AgmX/PglI C-terminal domain-containing protein [Archangium violaceum]|uniref:AgmX/PglI C-terminal domain-containing protein n=1 Tax=Archangium violaceum TaxID=83451 RepID=UPI00194EA727|nr:AgmX/PglI C-terminal domain-containing protein [Archangium violaceum]QRN95584.1 AgmX/PglI C-terminal domain-containing protein [Archangium violaceum]